MSRPLRIEYAFAYYHGMNRGLACRKIFKDRSDRERFLSLLGGGKGFRQTRSNDESC